ncbi:hypothetical protein H7992_14555 [Sporosarcina sp. resist]|uniref:hypothetical protein n=1 Tax=Sporosarcina sp. resist TaxID=2762563 RepID=UPI00164DFFE5|nr:hypothetical protein [Sporosarcina sp. resist]QNK86479.1 hypothetical protein H7992_14555 [Sporosarcina sp. resist]
MSKNHLIKNIVIVADLKNIEDKKIILYGIITDIIFSSSLIKKNSDFQNFTQDFFGVQFKGYVYKSRTLLLARCLRLIEKYDLEKVNVLIDKLLLVFNIHPPKNSKNNSKNLDVLLAWKKVINHE